MIMICIIFQLTPPYKQIIIEKRMDTQIFICSFAPCLMSFTFKSEINVNMDKTFIFQKGMWIIALNDVPFK